jgi:acyl-CoA reductase-like NAD-dependent aldehyde dehydrogenase
LRIDRDAGKEKYLMKLRRVCSVAYGEEMEAFIADVKFQGISGHRQGGGRSTGARLGAGGDEASVSSYRHRLLFKPTIFADVTSKMRTAQEEVVGAVLSVKRFDDEDDAVPIADDTRFGLAAARQMH